MSKIALGSKYEKRDDVPLSIEGAANLLWDQIIARRATHRAETERLFEVRELLLSLRHQRDLLLSVANEAERMLGRQGWLVEGTDHEAQVLRRLREAIAFAEGGKS